MRHLRLDRVIFPLANHYLTSPLYTGRPSKAGDGIILAERQKASLHSHERCFPV
jgi:hypothetical protein